MKFLKMIFSIRFNSQALNIWLLVLRITAGAFMLTHGFPKFQTLISGEEINFPDPIGWGVKTSFVLVIFGEFFCSILLILGLFTRLATIPLIISMLVAAFIAHGGDPFSAKELSLLYILIFTNILITGSGKYSLDYLISRKLEEKR